VPRAAFSVSFVFVLVASVGSSQTRAQATPEATPEHLQQLQTCRDGILDESARPTDRRRWVEMLFSYPTPQADALFVELLTLDKRPEVQTAVGEVFAALGSQNRSRLNPSFVAPLLAMLTSESEQLRSAAGAALAEFPSDQIADKLGELASNSDAPMVARIAAIDALAPNTHRRTVVKQLITLLDQSVPELTARVVAVLSPIAPSGFGANVQKWQAWWTTKSDLSREQWLAEQLKHYRKRARQTATKLTSVEQDLIKQQSALTARIRDFQGEVLRPLTGEQKEAKLAEWMNDSLAAVKQGAVALVRSQITDEGTRPSGEVLAALLRLLDHPSLTIRRDVLTIAENLQNETVIDAVLARLDLEKEPALRHAILHAVGMLASPKAIPALLREIQDDTKDAQSLTAAAQALGKIAATLPTGTDLQEAVQTLKNRYTKTPADLVGLRAALLTAMAGVADKSFSEEFLAALDSDDREILQPALRGLSVIGDSSKLARVRSLGGDADTRIRLVAIDALGVLGREPEDLESLLNHLNPSLEPDESVRQAAWRAFRKYLARRPMKERIAAAQRLRGLPDLETKYTEQLANVLATAGDYNDNLEILRERLATLATDAGKYEDAIPHLRELYAMRYDRQDPRAADDGIRWINAILQSAALQNLSEVIVRIAEGSASVAVRSSIVKTVRDYAEGNDLSADPKRTARLLVELRSINPELLGEDWPGLLTQIEDKSKPPTPAETTTPSP